jgi:hypothetical protein
MFELVICGMSENDVRPCGGPSTPIIAGSTDGVNHLLGVNTTIARYTGDIQRVHIRIYIRYILLTPSDLGFICSGSSSCGIYHQLYGLTYAASAMSDQFHLNTSAPSGAGLYYTRCCKPLRNGCCSEDLTFSRALARAHVSSVGHQ